MLGTLKDYWCNYACAKFYSPSEPLAVDEVTVLFKGAVILKQCTPKKHKCFSTKIYILHNMTSCAYNMIVQPGRTGKMKHKQ